MTTRSDRFPSKYLKADDIDQDYEATIREVSTEMFKDDTGQSVKKYLVWFDEFDKALMLNKTNDGLICAQHGEDDKGWIGKTVVLSVEDVPFKGEIVPAIRVKRPARPVRPQKSIQAPPKGQPAPQSKRETAETAVDEQGNSEADNIPF